MSSRSGGGGYAGIIAVKLDGPADSLELALYSTALVRVDHADPRLKASGSYQAGWANQLPIPADLMMGLPSGTYYYVVVVKRGSLKCLKPLVGKLTWLK
jgi:hypothetical protein